MTLPSKWLGIISVLLTLFVFTGCARHSVDLEHREIVVIANKGINSSLEQSMAPAFYLTGTHKDYNRIGKVFATGTQHDHKIAISPEHPVFYVGTRQFLTEKSIYTNLIYRIHFLEQPYSLIPFNYGAGEHVGLLVILTLDQHDQVVLVTTAQTCGCYAVTVPTKTLPVAAYPRNWPDAELVVAGERLPPLLPAIGPQDILRIDLRPEVHRVMNISVIPRMLLTTGVVNAVLADLASLKKLPLEDGTTTSFYHQYWPLTGHVKEAIKPWETLLLGLVSLDLFVGMDKEYGGTLESGNPFYTSLKPWNRSVSDMNDFAGYLRFNGWRL